MSQEVAKALLEIDAIGFVQHPITFKSGMKSPVYVDNRRLPFNPEQWHVVIGGFIQLIEELGLQFDVIAGIETAGIPHSSVLAYELNKPSVFVRKAAKDHGTKKMIEGGDVKGKRVLLIEDHITTGGSSLHGVTHLEESGATVVACLAITSYGFKESLEEFKQANVSLHVLTQFKDILPAAIAAGKCTEGQKTEVEKWLQDPWKWGEGK